MRIGHAIHIYIFTNIWCEDRISLFRVIVFSALLKLYYHHFYSFLMCEYIFTEIESSELVWRGLTVLAWSRAFRFDTQRNDWKRPWWFSGVALKFYDDILSHVKNFFFFLFIDENIHHIAGLWKLFDEQRQARN